MTYSTPARPQPPSITDPEQGEYDATTLGQEIEDDSEKVENVVSGRTNWIKLAKDAYQFSTSYIDSNFRKQWEDSIKAFNSQHPGDSKYSSELFRKRSQIFRPKIRAAMRKNEAANAAAYFSNLDRVSVSAQNQNDKKQRISAEIMQQLLQYRLTKSIRWFQTVQGGLQDAQKQCAAIAHPYWSYVTHEEDGRLITDEDKPCIDLIPIENIRFDPSSSWIDPINTSPYVIELIPMFVCDVKTRMERPDPKGRTWKEYDDQIIMQARDGEDTTRRARIDGQQDGNSQSRPISDYDIVWVHRHIHRREGQDYVFFTLKSQHMLTDPEPLKNVVFHGERDYILGVCNLETHTPLPKSVPELAKGLTDEMNDLVNQSLDNQKLVINKRYFAKRGKNVDLASLVRNVPGGITLVDDVETDVKTIEFSDITPGAFQQQDRLNLDFDELLGNFSAAAVQMQKPGQTSTGMMLAQAPANLLTEYMLKTYTETFVQPLLRQLCLLEQHYETDRTILYLAGDKAQIFQKYGQNEITDDMLDHEIVVNVNVGMGATDPVAKLNRFSLAVNLLLGIAKAKVAVPFLQLQEISKEIFALSGYQDGTRFLTDQDPDKVQAQAQVTQLANVIKQLQMKLKDKSDSNTAKVQVGREKNQTAVILEMLKHDNALGQMFAEAIIGKAEQPETPNTIQ